MNRLGSIVKRSAQNVSIPSVDRIPAVRVPVTEGQDYNVSTGGSYARFTGRIYMYRYFIVQTILWDIRNAGTYTCDFLTTGAGSTSELNILPATALGSGEITITPVTGDFLMTPGSYYLSLLRSASAGWWMRDASYWYGSNFWLYQTWYNGSSYTGFSIPIKLQGYYLEVDYKLDRYSKA